MNKFWRAYRDAVRAPTYHRAELMSIQWLRGLAVLMVMVYHVEDLARQIPAFSGFHSFWVEFGYSAPDLFFVISGFIMSYVTFGMKFEPRRWLVSRFVRIYPVYIAFTTLAIGLWLCNPEMTMGSGTHTWGSVFRSLIIFPQAGLPLIFVGWTVEHEIVFYSLVFCVATLGWGNRGLLTVTGTLSFLAALRWLLRDYVPGLDFWDYHFLSLFMVQFFIGVAIFQFWERLRSLGHIAPLILSLVLFIIGGLVCESETINNENLPRVLIFGLSFGSLLLAAINYEERLRKTKGDAYPPKKRPFLVQAGDASYSLYLSHPFCLATSGKILALFSLSGPVGVIAVLAAGAFTVCFGMAFYTLAEKPLLQFMKVLTTRKKKTELSQNTA